MHYYHFYLPWVSSPDDMLPEHAPVYSYPFAPRPLKTIFVVIDFTSLNIKIIRKTAIRFFSNLLFLMVGINRLHHNIVEGVSFYCPYTDEHIHPYLLYSFFRYKFEFRQTASIMKYAIPFPDTYDESAVFSNAKARIHMSAIR